MAKASPCVLYMTSRSINRTRRGGAAIEFAMVGPFFIFLICVAFDLGLLLFTQTVLNNAARDAARIIMTNQAGSSSSAFASKLCSDMEGLINCSDLQYYVQSGASFSAMNASVQTSGTSALQSNGVFNPGSPGEDVIVQVAYNRPTLVPWVLNYMNGTHATISKSSNLLVATVVFQNEP